MKMSEVQDEVLRYWLKACPDTGGPYPCRNDIKVTDMRHRMAYVAVLDVETDPIDYRYRLIGTKLRDFLFEDYTGQGLREIEGKGPGTKIWSIIDKVRTSGEPLFCEVPYIGPKADFKRASSLYLPLASDHKVIDKIMIVTNFKRIEQIDFSADFDPSDSRIFPVEWNRNRG